MVSISLSAREDDPTAIGGNTTTHTTLQIEDTGIGMSSEFVKHDMFTPFRQADSHSAGTGLGLSIVREVAKDFNATVEVDSEPGKGTIVSIRFAANFTDQPSAKDSDTSDATASKPRQLCMLHMDDGQPQPDALGTKYVKDSVQRTATHWLACEVFSSRGMTHKVPASLCVVSENDLSYLHSLSADTVKSYISSLTASGSRVVVLGRSIASAQPLFEFEDFAVSPIYIHQPIGPRKLLRAITSAKDSTITRQTSDYALHGTPAKPTSRIIKGDAPQNTTGDTGSYFELPRADNDQDSPTSKGVISPKSFMDASSAQTPKSDVGDPADATGQSKEDTILLVEDNAINMKVGKHVCPRVTEHVLIHTRLLASGGAHEEARPKLPLCKQWSGSAECLSKGATAFLPSTHGYEHACNEWFRIDRQDPRV